MLLLAVLSLGCWVKAADADRRGGTGTTSPNSRECGWAGAPAARQPRCRRTGRATISDGWQSRWRRRSGVMRRILMCLLIAGLSVAGPGAWYVSVSQASSLHQGSEAVARTRAIARVSPAKSRPSAVRRPRAGGLSVLSNALVTPGSPTQGEQVRSQEEASRSNPEAVVQREASRTKFEGLGSFRAAAVASESFPSLVDEQAAGLPVPSVGGQVTGYLSDQAARISLPEGKYAVIEARGGGIRNLCHAAPCVALAGGASGPVGAAVGIGVAVACNGR
jgi:hypothetical protein